VKEWEGGTFKRSKERGGSGLKKKKKRDLRKGEGDARKRGVDRKKDVQKKGIKNEGKKGGRLIREKESVSKGGTGNDRE